MNHHYPEITLLVTHYNRSESLRHLLRTFKTLNCTFGDIVVSDDGSRPEHLEKIKDLQQTFPFRLITTPQNRGLGNNINKGQDSVTTPYTLYVQEDFEPLPPFPARLTEALGYMKRDLELDLVRFYAYLLYPYLKPFTQHFSEMQVPALGTNYHKIYCYSDHPHLRRSTFLQRFGRYAEGVKVDRTEYRMCIAFIRNKGKALFFNDYQSLFHQNDALEGSTVQRRKWTTSHNSVISLARNIYRQLRYNYDLYF